MAQPAARMNDPVTGTDLHTIINPSGATVPAVPHPYAGRISSGCSTDVQINGQPAALQGSGSTLNAPHVPQGGSFSVLPTGQGTVVAGSATVLVNGKPLARVGDPVQTCNDPAPAPTSKITGGSTDVMAG